MENFIAEIEPANILVVDDQPENLLAMLAVLEGLGQNLVKASSGREALRHLLEMDFAVVLLDVQMPDMDGFETAAMIRQRERSLNTPIIFMTAAFHDAEHTGRAYATGAVDYMFKPVSPKILRAKVSVFVELHKKTEQLRKLTESQARLLEELAERNTALERASKFKDQFLSTMSHELRTPLTGILGFSDLLLEESHYGPLNERQQRSITQIRSGGQYLLRLVNNILDLSRIEAGRLELAIEAVSVNTAFAEVLSALRPLSEKKSQDVVCDTAESLKVHADELRFKQILMNLLGNAIKFTPEGGHIGLMARPEDGRVRVEVRDTGPGISPQDQKRIFEAFYRLHQLDRSSQGTGLGLAITQRMVELQGGTIGVESEPGKGSCFYFTLPEAQVAASPPQVLV